MYYFPLKQKPYTCDTCVVRHGCPKYKDYRVGLPVSCPVLYEADIPKVRAVEKKYVDLQRSLYDLGKKEEDK